MNDRKTTYLLAAVLIAGLQTTMAQSSQQPGQSSSSQSQSQSQTQAQSARVSELMDAKVKSQDNKDLGTAEDLIVDPKSGKIQFVVVGQGGSLGVGQDLIPVPWTSASVRQTGQGEQEISLRVSSQRLQSAPALQRDYSNLSDPSFARLVNQFYSTSGMGGSESPEGSQQGQESSQPTDPTQTSTNGASSSMGGSDSPGGSQQSGGSSAYPSSSTNQFNTLPADE